MTRNFLTAALYIAFVLAVALAALSAQSDASRALPTSDAPFVQALRAEVPIDQRPVRSAAPTTAPSATVAAGGLPFASRSVLPAPTPMPRHALSGQATWWDSWGHGLYAAAGPRLRAAMGAYLGRIVTVCAATCVRVTLTTSCACQPDTRLIDLSLDAFSQLAAPGRGIIPVIVRW